MLGKAAAAAAVAVAVVDEGAMNCAESEAGLCDKVGSALTEAAAAVGAGEMRATLCDRICED